MIKKYRVSAYYTVDAVEKSGSDLFTADELIEVSEVDSVCQGNEKKKTEFLIGDYVQIDMSECDINDPRLDFDCGRGEIIDTVWVEE